MRFDPREILPALGAVLCLSLAAGCLSGRPGGVFPAGRSTPDSAVKKIFLDTDMLTDCDDAAAIAILLNLEAASECEVVGMAVSSRHEVGEAVVSAVNTYYGRSGIPVGAPKNGRGAYRADSCFLDAVAGEFPHPLRSNDEAPDAVALYRKTLAGAEDGSVVIVTIGYMSNLAALLESGPDEFSPLDGRALVARKAARWICMGGNFPVDPARDNVNFTRDMPAAYKAITEWPGELHFVGREIGHTVFAGEGLRSTEEGNPVRRAYQLHRSRFTPDDWNHHTADPCTVLYAVRGTGEYFTRSGAGYIDLKPDGSFAWKDDPSRTQRYLFLKMPNADLAALLDGLMSKTPDRPAAP